MTILNQLPKSGTDRPSVDLEPQFMEEFEQSPVGDVATGSLLAYSSAHQIACCRSLSGIGFGNISLNQIGKYIESARSWCHHLEALTDDPECLLFFPDCNISMLAIGQLARFHDCKLSPPAAVPRLQNLQETSRHLNQARQEFHELRTRLSLQRYWIDTARMPLTEESLEHLYQLLQPLPVSGSTLDIRNRYQQSIQWASAYLVNNADLSTQRACGNLRKLTTLVEQALQFARCRRYKTAFGDAFDGLDSDFSKLHSDLRFFAEVQRVLKPSGADEFVLSNWADNEARFFSLCRKASTVRRRLHKLNRLVKRQYFTPSEPTGYIALAHKSISRLHIWLTVLKSIQQSGNLTPQQLLETLVTPRAGKTEASGQILA